MRFDIAIIGGGINGCGIARDAAGRGASVLLVEKGDLAGATSSASSKLIHGGLRYLEHYKFGLVREALAERETLWRIAPHLVRPLRFVLPHRAGMRPKWMLRAGLFLYDTLAPRRLLEGTKTLSLRAAGTKSPLKPEFNVAFAYSDCAVDDSRLTVLNAKDASERGADIRTRTELVGVERFDDHWLVHLRDEAGSDHRVEARVLVNAAGPWVGKVDTMALGSQSAPIRLVRGSHILVRREIGEDLAYVFQNRDKRVVFAIAYGPGLTLIGTTDEEHTGSPESVAITDKERDYLIASANDYLREPLGVADIVWAYAGVRPLYDDGVSAAKDATREYVLTLNDKAAPILTVYGGKITTYRKLAEAVLSRLASHLPKLGNPQWTGEVPLPGGDFAIGELPARIDALCARYRAVPRNIVARIVAAYGSRATRILHKSVTDAGLGRDFGAGLTEAELSYLVDEEWVRSAADAIWRRSKLGLELDADQVADIEAFIAARLAHAAQAAV